MGSLLIKGLEMPENTAKIYIAFFLRDGSYEGVEDIWSIEAQNIHTPHGRLIDADELMKHLADDGREAFTKHQVWLMLSEYGAPTIIEAEE